MKHFYPILVSVLFIPFNLNAQFEIKELNDSVLKPKIIDFSKCLCLDSLKVYSRDELNTILPDKELECSRYSYFDEGAIILIDDLLNKLSISTITTEMSTKNGVYLIFNYDNKKIPVLISNYFSHCEVNEYYCENVNKVKLSENTIIYEIAINISICRELSGTDRLFLKKLYLIISEGKYYLMTLEEGKSERNWIWGIHTPAYQHSSKESISRQINLSKDTLFISKWRSEKNRMFVVNDSLIYKNDIKNGIKIDSTKYTINDSIGEDSFYKFEFPNFVKVNH